jgi:anti-sigma regulatory factor (Ser/Thr protein kinase)
MFSKQEILKIARKKGKIYTRSLAFKFRVSRQYATLLASELVSEHKLIKLGSTKKAYYVLPEYAKKHKEIFPSSYRKTYSNRSLEEHKILDQIEKSFSPARELPENIQSIFTYAFSEMLNNAIEHSASRRIGVDVSVRNNKLFFDVSDSGIGVFRNIMKKRKLNSELEAIQDLMKGKTTTMPKAHSGEGIFFTSKAADLFILDSFGSQLIVNNAIPDVFIKKTKKIKRGTRVTFEINFASKKHLKDIFDQYTNQTEGSDYGFDKTMIKIKLYTISGIHISRSQARRVLSGLDKFKIIVFDFDKVPLVGQAFADEIFRVFHMKHPNIKLEPINMNEAAKFMVERAIYKAKEERI